MSPALLVAHAIWETIVEIAVATYRMSWRWYAGLALMAVVAVAIPVAVHPGSPRADCVAASRSD